MTTQEAKEAGRGQGFSDGCEWVRDESHEISKEDTSDVCSKEQLADSLRGALKSSVSPDEGLINALTEHDLDKLMGIQSRDSEGDLTPAASSWLEGYNSGWRSAVEDRLAKLEA